MKYFTDTDNYNENMGLYGCMIKINVEFSLDDIDKIPDDILLYILRENGLSRELKIESSIFLNDDNLVESKYSDLFKKENYKEIMKNH